VKAFLLVEILECRVRGVSASENETVSEENQSCEHVVTKTTTSCLEEEMEDDVPEVNWTMMM
jgi:hypothetical protein